MSDNPRTFKAQGWVDSCGRKHLDKNSLVRAELCRLRRGRLSFFRIEEDIADLLILNRAEVVKLLTWLDDQK